MDSNDLQNSIQGLANELELIAKRKLGHPGYRVYLSARGVMRVWAKCRSLWVTKTSQSYIDLKQDLLDFRKSLTCRLTFHEVKAGKQFDRCVNCNQWFKRQ